MDGNGFDVIIGRSSLLCSSFVILEATIVFVSKHSDQDEKGALYVILQRHHSSTLVSHVVGDECGSLPLFFYVGNT